ncbi:MAG: hypothetical protein HQM13_17790 [SAR324 cluster bacterium]|nr:hypothetical protein [SAR324 cluster bacterium]
MFIPIKFSVKARLLGIFCIAGILTFCYLINLIDINIRQWGISWLENNSVISIFLSDSISKSSYQNLYVFLENDFRIHNIREISSQEAFSILNQEVELNKSLLSTTDANILPTTIDFEIRQEYFTQTETIIKQVEKLDGVTEIIYPKGTMETIEHLFQGLDQFAMALWIVGGLLIAAILFFLIFLSLQAYSEELALLELFGTSNWKVCSAFLFETGKILGFSILLSWVITFICYHISKDLPSFQKILIISKQTNTFYQLHDLLLIGLLTFVCGEIYSYLLTKYLHGQQRMQMK